MYFSSFYIINYFNIIIIECVLLLLLLYIYYDNAGDAEDD